MSTEDGAETPDLVAFTRPSRRVVMRWLAGGAALGLFYVGLLVVMRWLGLDDAAARAAGRAGPWGVAVFVLLLMAAVMSPLPDSPIALAGLVAYGPGRGVMLVVGSMWLAAVADFWLMRLLGREAIRRRFPRFVAQTDAVAGQLGFEALVIGRLVPSVSFDLLSYSAGLTRMSFRRFAVATLIGLTPGPALAALAGAAAGGVHPGLSVLLGALMLMVLGAGLWVRWRLARRRRRSRSLPAPSDD